MSFATFMAWLFIGGPLLLLFIYICVRLVASAWFRTKTSYLREQKHLFFHQRKEDSE